jgi:hypothetical protein
MTMAAEIRNADGRPVARATAAATLLKTEAELFARPLVPWFEIGRDDRMASFGATFWRTLKPRTTSLFPAADLKAGAIEHRVKFSAAVALFSL